MIPELFWNLGSGHPVSGELISSCNDSVFWPPEILGFALFTVQY